jgi:Fic family protein
MIIIHPVIDGNRRTTRLTTKVLLAAMGLKTFNLFSFENYYNKNIIKYFHKVDELLRVQKLFPETILNPENELQPYHLKILYTQKRFSSRATRALDKKN